MRFGSISICTPRAWPGFGIELDIRKGRTDHQQRVAIFHRFLRGLGSQQSDAAGRIGAVVGHRRFPQQSFDDRRAEYFGRLFQFIGRVKAPRPARIATFLPALRMSAARRRSRSSGSRALRAQMSDV